ncbi:hypothetical protein DFA_06745 [Cavenderia fasciculata]|uniref:Uncharacterized protein n=1 Tax=Cavenderia fasciculata TaxID=261658 RepID=F4Q258_CACFS|nr:uncharacterized protein DFA_06745 [Cavenderia fasciculata]EGG18078.1 hypothetical protein DFA_06745 [Cavenderia fasciculata]|eukprot:XP_004366119.1 hypothetical protein DFA_06745 [Cavenderia fasciculata]
MMLIHTTPSNTQYLPTISIKWTDTNNKPKVSKIEPYFNRKKDDPTNSWYPPYVMDLDYKVPTSLPTSSDTCWQDPIGFSHPKIADITNRYCHYSRKAILSPLRFDFVLDADFLTSTTTPVITVTGVPSTTDPMFSIVRFESSEGITFDKTGFKPMTTTYVSTTVAQTYGSVLVAPLITYLNNSPASQNSFSSFLKVFYNTQDLSQIKDKVQIYYTNPSGTETLLGEHQFTWNNDEHKFTFNLFSHPYVTGTPTYRYKLNNQIGSTCRVDWALSMQPQPTVSTWKRRALYHHTLMNSYQYLTSQSTAYLSMNMISMDPSRFPYLYTRNYVMEKEAMNN